MILVNIFKTKSCNVVNINDYVISQCLITVTSALPIDVLVLLEMFYSNIERVPNGDDIKKVLKQANPCVHEYETFDTIYTTKLFGRKELKSKFEDYISKSIHHL